MFHRKRILFAALAIAAIPVTIVAVYYTWGNILDPLDGGRTVVAVPKFIGQTREAIEAKYRKPSDYSAGHFGLPDISYVKQHSPAISATYMRFSGRLFLSFEQRQGEWVCFRSLWCPNGWDFD